MPRSTSSARRLVVSTLGDAPLGACGHPSLAATERTIVSLRAGEVEAAWRRALAAPTLTAVLRG